MTLPQLAAELARAKMATLGLAPISSLAMHAIVAKVAHIAYRETELSRLKNVADFKGMKCRQTGMAAEIWNVIKNEDWSLLSATEEGEGGSRLVVVEATGREKESSPSHAGGFEGPVPVSPRGTASVIVESHHAWTDSE